MAGSPLHAARNEGKHFKRIRLRTAFTMSRQQHGDGQLLGAGPAEGRRLERSQAGNATVFRSQLLRRAPGFFPLSSLRPWRPRRRGGWPAREKLAIAMLLARHGEGGRAGSFEMLTASRIQFRYLADRYSKSEIGYHSTENGAAAAPHESALNPLAGGLSGNRMRQCVYRAGRGGCIDPAGRSLAKDPASRPAGRRPRRARCPLSLTADA